MGIVVALASAALASVGCASSVPPDAAFQLSDANRKLARGSLAAVEIRGHSLTTVTNTVESVFAEAGFATAARTADRMTFERLASRGQLAAYGNWFGDMEVRLRLRVDIIRQGTDQFFLSCRSFAVREAGFASEDEQPLARHRVRAYGDLLYEVASRLN